MYEKQFLNDVARQNYTKYNIDVSDWINKIDYDLMGSMFTVNKRYPDDVVKNGAAVFSKWFRRPYLEKKMIAHLPIAIEPNLKGIHTSNNRSSNWFDFNANLLFQIWLCR